MTNKLTPDEFINKILNGQTDFSETKISGDLRLNPEYQELIRYLTYKNYTYLFTYADLSNLIAPQLNLMGADFRGAILTEADFRGAILTEADFTGANLKWAIFT
ncbi:MAG: pentapeptide repeat-containing protein, partial [Candidatus Woesearchaeota archaeon]